MPKHRQHKRTKQITPRGAAALPAYTALTHLTLCGGWLTDRAAAEAAKLPALKHLNIAQNPRLVAEGRGEEGVVVCFPGAAPL